MINLTIFISYYFLILFSVIGYGSIILANFKKDTKLNNLGYKGIIGVLFLIIYSYISHFFIPHSMLHNTILIILGLFFFIIKINKNKNEILVTASVFFVLLIGIILFKTHDDFPYYHFPYSFYLTQNSILFGVGQFNHGFRTPSSIFYLNSLFYLPIIKYNLFHISSVLIMGFTNLIFLDYLKKNVQENKINYITFFTLLSFIFINIFFYRIAEHGTDRSAQILILLLFIEIFIFISLQDTFDEHLSKLYILIALIMSLKAFYVLYLITIIPVLTIYYKNYKLKKSIYLITKNNFFLIFILTISLVLVTNLINTGCLLYPISITCIENLSWAINLDQVKQMNDWYELWSKGGANPHGRVENPDLHIQYFNWVSNWIDTYFFNKVSDFLLGLLFLGLVFYYSLFSRNTKNIKTNKVSSIYVILFLLLFEWFYNHPSLRYGGYSLIASIWFLFLSKNLEKKLIDISRIKKVFLGFLILTLIIFITRNVNRIIAEKEQYKFNPIQNVYFGIDKKHFRIKEKFDDLIMNHKFCEVKDIRCDINLKPKMSRIANTFIFRTK